MEAAASGSKEKCGTCKSIVDNFKEVSKNGNIKTASFLVAKSSLQGMIIPNWKENTEQVDAFVLIWEENSSNLVKNNYTMTGWPICGEKALSC